MIVRFLFMVLSLLVLMAYASTQGPPQTQVTISLSPTNITLLAGVKTVFKASVTGTDNKAVSWQATGGTVEGTGLDVTYVAPKSTTATSYTVTVTSQADPSKNASATVNLSDSLTSLPGDGTTPATSAIPELDFVPRAEDYRTDHPELGGVAISFNTLYMVFTLDTTVAQVNNILGDLGAEIVGGLPGIADVIEGILIVRLPTKSHEEMIARLAELEQHPKVMHVVQDSLLDVQAIPNNNGSNPTGWDWFSTPGDGNWGLELIRAPQMWNLNEAIKKRGNTTLVGVLDGGFNTSHPDLSYFTNLSPDYNKANFPTSHGTQVAGIIGATFNNGKGVDGVNPFAKLVVKRNELNHTFGVFNFIFAQPAMKVVNMSLGAPWPASINFNTNKAAQNLITEQGKIVIHNLKVSEKKGVKMPFILVAAGNNSTIVNNEAKWTSALAYAALELSAPNIMVVEALELDNRATGGAKRAGFSNINGDISAPGVDIMSTSIAYPGKSGIYHKESGTSMAAPHVAGLMSFLLAVDPSLTHDEIRKLLLDQAVTVAGGASKRIDGFASVMAINQLKGNDKVLKMLLDIDDGSLDGNQRVNLETMAVVTSEDLDADGGVGDGSIDMADFRRFRDWLLRTEGNPGLKLNGAINHPKKDVNGNGHVDLLKDFANIYPKADFNGDGQLSRSAKRHVPGVINAEVTDLEVLQARFDDPDYNASDLPGLLNSGDLELDGKTCLNHPEADSVTSSLRDQGTVNVIQTFVLKDSDTDTLARRNIYTAPADYTFTARISVVNDQRETVSTVKKDAPIELGSDTLWQPACDYLLLDISKPALKKGQSGPLRIRAALKEGDEAFFQFQSGVDISLETKNAHVDVANGSTDANGYFETRVTAEADLDEVEIIVTGKLERTQGDETKTSQKTETVTFGVTGDITVEPASLALQAEVEQSVIGSFELVNFSTEANYQATQGARFAKLISNAAGSLAPKTRQRLSLKATCPNTAGNYSDSIALSFSSPDGTPIKDGVPLSVPIELECRDQPDQERQGSLGASFGDPHLSSSDGFYYDFQAIGDYVLSQARDASDSFEVQVRYGKATASDPWCCGNYSFNKAVAMNVAGDVVELYAQTNTIDVYINGEKRALDAGSLMLQLPKGGSLRVSDNGATVTWPDRSYVSVSRSHSVLLDLRLYLPGSRWQGVKGLLGNFDGDPSNDIQLQDGTVIRDPEPADYYQQYRRDWRVSPERSLFSQGQDPFDSSFPPPDSLISAEQLKANDPKAYAEAEATCLARGVVTPEMLASCIVDVALTGDPSWAEVALGLDPNIPRLIMNPALTFVPKGGQQRLGTIIAGLANREVSWTVSRGSFVKQTENSILFTAPNTAGSYTVTATSVADPSLSDSTTVVVFEEGQVFWDGGGDGSSWHDPKNWSFDVLPGSGDVVSLDVPEDATIIYSNGTSEIAGLNSKENLAFRGGKLTIQGEASLEAPVSLHAGFMEINAALVSHDLFTMTGGTLAGSGSLTLNGDMELSGNGAKTIAIARLDNASKLSWSAGQLNSASTLVLNNLPGASLMLMADGNFGSSNTAAATLNNEGSLQKTADTGVTNLNFVMNNQGSLEVQTGRLKLNRGGNSSGVFHTEAGASLDFGGETHTLDAIASISGAGEVTVSAGTLSVAGTYSSVTKITNGRMDINGSATMAALELSFGTLAGSGDISVSGFFDWTGGSIDGNGSLT